MNRARGDVGAAAIHSVVAQIATFAALIVGLSATASAQTPIATAASDSFSWPQFRGPRGDGTALEADPPTTWNPTCNVTWKIPILGRGRSSPAILGNRIWLTTAVEQGVVRTHIGPDDMQTAEHVSLRAVCLDRRSGKIVWEVVLFEVPNPDPVHWFNSWATPTPVAEEGSVYCDFGTFGTACLDAATGKPRWSRQLRLDHQVGPGSSPILWKDRLILIRDGRDAQYVTALDKKTGQSLWRHDRPPIDVASPNQKKSFSTPLIAEHDGQPQVIAPGAHWTVSYDPLTGKEIWRVRHGKGFSIGTAPVVGHDLVFFGTGCFKAELWAVRLGGSNDVTETHFAWKTPRQVPVMSSPLVVGNELYWVSDDGMATCADARTGRIYWQERLDGACLASPLAARDRIYFFRQDAKTIVLKPGTQFERLAENPLEGTLIATPAIAGNSLFVRTDTHLYRIEN